MSVVSKKRDCIYNLSKLSKWNGIRLTKTLKNLEKGQKKEGKQSFSVDLPNKKTTKLSEKAAKRSHFLPL